MLRRARALGLASLISAAAAAALTLPLMLTACGGGAAETAPAVAPASSAADGGASAAKAAPSTPIGPLPPERPVPPLGLGSKIARVRGRAASEPLGDPPLPTCAMSAAAPTPEATATASARACAPTMKPMGAPRAITIGDRNPGATVALDAAPGCHRVFVGLGAGVENVVVSILDSKGLLAAAARSEPSARVMVVPADGPLCFDAADAAKIIVSAGRGQGAASVQIARE